MKACLMVEGTKDKDQISSAFNGFEGADRVKCLVTEGTKVNNRIMAEVENYIREGYDIYILSDPDEAGDHLVEMIQHWYPHIPRLEVDYKQCAYFTGKKFKAGIEYASHNYLRKLISPLVGVEYKEPVCPICWD